MFLQTLSVVLGLSLLLSGLMLAPVVVAACAFGARPQPRLLTRMVCWGALLIVACAFVIARLG